MRANSLLASLHFLIASALVFLLIFLYQQGDLEGIGQYSMVPGDFSPHADPGGVNLTQLVLILLMIGVPGVLTGVWLLRKPAGGSMPVSTVLMLMPLFLYNAILMMVGLVMIMLIVWGMIFIDLFTWNSGVAMLCWGGLTVVGYYTVRQMYRALFPVQQPSAHLA